MCEKRCSACKQFKDLTNFVNEGNFCIIRSHFKICSACRKRAKKYYKGSKYGCVRRRTYNKTITEYRRPLENCGDDYEVEANIMYDPNNVVCYVEPGDVLLFVGDYHLSEFKFQTLDEARGFRDWAFGLLKDQNLNQ